MMVRSLGFSTVLLGVLTTVGTAQAQLRIHASILTAERTANQTGRPILAIGGSET